MNPPKLLGRAAVNTVVAISVLYTLLPALWLVLAATKDRDALFGSDILSLQGFSPVKNLRDLFAMDKGIYGRWYFNSLLYAVGRRRRGRAGQHRLRLRVRQISLPAQGKTVRSWSSPR